MGNIYQKIQGKIPKYGEYVFLFLLILISVFSTTLYNFSKEKIVEEYKELFENIYFKQTVNTVFSSTQPRFLVIKYLSAS